VREIASAISAVLARSASLARFAHLTYLVNGHAQAAPLHIYPESTAREGGLRHGSGTDLSIFTTIKKETGTAWSSVAYW
jgi:hypothetical protein